MKGNYKYNHFLKKRIITEGYDCQNSFYEGYRPSSRPHQTRNVTIRSTQTVFQVGVYYKKNT
jgi:hypothetical protein